MYMGTESEAQKRYQRQGSSFRRQSFDRRQRLNSRDSRYGGFQRQLRYDGPRSRDRREDRNHDRLQTPAKSMTSDNFLRCIGCRCRDCNQIKKDCEEIKGLITKKADVNRVNEVTKEITPATAINLCNQDVVMGEEKKINYTYTDFGRQMMILDIGAPVSLAGVSWMSQYLKEFGLTIGEMKSVRCSQPFVFVPSNMYLSESLVELPVLIMRLDGKEDVLTIQTYLIDAEVPFLCGKQTMEGWNFKIDG